MKQTLTLPLLFPLFLLVPHRTDDALRGHGVRLVVAQRAFDLNLAHAQQAADDVSESRVAHALAVRDEEEELRVVALERQHFRVLWGEGRSCFINSRKKHGETSVVQGYL